jgi:predicted MFS family arabinose efflux permease
LAGLIYGFLESAIFGWAHPRVIGSLTFGVVSLLLFLFVEKTETMPMVPLKLFQSASFSAANLLTLFLYSALGIFLFLFPLNLIQIQKYSATATGAATLPMILLMFALSRWSGGLLSRYGPKVPLILGPLVAAVAFLLFALPNMQAGYWTAFFPAFIVLGLGMAITVAPLTTVVMNSVEQARAGTASGINNAVSRVAGVLAVAVLGAIMAAAFSHSLRHSLSGLHLNAAVVQELQSNTAKLGSLDAPSTVDPQTASTIRSAIAESFLFGFRLIMLLCAALAIASAGVAWRMMPAKALSRS